MGIKKWRCPNGHILGIVERTRRNGRRSHRLVLFREAVVEEGHGKRMAILIGSAPIIECSICGAKRGWWEAREKGEQND